MPPLTLLGGCHWVRVYRFWVPSSTASSNLGRKGSAPRPGAPSLPSAVGGGGRRIRKGPGERGREPSGQSVEGDREGAGGGAAGGEAGALGSARPGPGRGSGWPRPARARRRSLQCRGRAPQSQALGRRTAGLMSGSRRRKGRGVLFPALPAGVELDSRPWPPAPLGRRVPVGRGYSRGPRAARGWAEVRAETRKGGGWRRAARRAGPVHTCFGPLLTRGLASGARPRRAFGGRRRPRAPRPAAARI